MIVKLGNTKILEIKLELKLFFRFLTVFAILIMMGFAVIAYNMYSLKLDKEILQTNNRILAIQNDILELKKEKAKLISPERIERKAKEELNMIDVNLENVKFLVND